MIKDINDEGDDFYLTRGKTLTPTSCLAQSLKSTVTRKNVITVTYIVTNHDNIGDIGDAHKDCH